MATSTVTSVISTIPIIEAVASPVLANVTEVEEGTTIHAIYLRVEVFATNAFSSVPRIYMLVFKDLANQLSNPNPSGSGISPVKRQILHQEMTMVGNGAQTAFPRTMFQGVVRIPPRLKRFGYGDKLFILLQNDAGETTGITNVCIQAIYKEFR